MKKIHRFFYFYRMTDPGNQQEHILSDSIKDFNTDRILAIKKKIRKTRDAIFATAGLLLISDLLTMAMNDSFSFDSIVISLIISCVFVLLGVLTEKHPFPSILIALILFGCLWILQMIVLGPQSLLKGILVKGLIFYFLATGLGHARQVRDLQKELKAN
jgi:hypothetical protein